MTSPSAWVWSVLLDIMLIPVYMLRLDSMCSSIVRECNARYLRFLSLHRSIWIHFYTHAQNLTSSIYKEIYSYTLKLPNTRKMVMHRYNGISIRFDEGVWFKVGAAIIWISSWDQTSCLVTWKSTAFETTLQSIWDNERLWCRHRVYSWLHILRPKKLHRATGTGLLIKNKFTLHQIMIMNLVDDKLPLILQDNGPPESPLQESVPPSRNPAHIIPSGKVTELISLP